ncbi:MAG: DMT family transporter [Desulfovibrio sp.]|nr:DMT family transporter [Desulfovibrio sp.]
MQRLRKPGKALGLRFTLQEWALCGVTMLWGATFLVVRLCMQESGPFWFVGLRFSAASVALLLCSLPVLRGITRRELLGGTALGMVIFCGFSLQTMGLVEISAAQSAFITAFYVPLVPLFELLLMRHRPKPSAWIGMALAFPGVLLLTGTENISAGFGSGSGVTLLCAVAFAVEIVLTGVIVPGTNPRRIACVELTVTALLGFASMPLAGESPPPLSWLVVVGACGMGLLTACIQSVIAWAQKTVPPTRATIIYTGEPIWGGLFGYMAGERLPTTALLGCCLVVSGILVSSAKKHSRQAANKPLARHSS